MKPLPAIGDITPVPKHVAIIMDGNGRWAAARHLPRTVGHKRGAEAVRRAVTAAGKLGISHLTLFGFSSENWKRPHKEIRDLMRLLCFYLRNELAEMMENGVRLRIIGNRDRLEPDIIELIEDVEAQTKANTTVNLTIALSYGGRSEIVTAARKIAEKAVRGEIALEEITESFFADHLETAGIPDPDLLIRTSGEKRISNFLLWQSAYTEFVFLDKFWPDFTEEDLEYAIREFACRERRYGTSGA
ncbi:MAG: isoprenyl transferase [Pseudomonadota bacterium]